MNELMNVLYSIVLYCRPLRFKECGGDPLISGPNEVLQSTPKWRSITSLMSGWCALCVLMLMGYVMMAAVAMTAASSAGGWDGSICDKSAGI